MSRVGYELPLLFNILRDGSDRAPGQEDHQQQHQEPGSKSYRNRHQKDPQDRLCLLADIQKRIGYAAIFLHGDSVHVIPGSAGFISFCLPAPFPLCRRLIFSRIRLCRRCAGPMHPCIRFRLCLCICFRLCGHLDAKSLRSAPKKREDIFGCKVARM